MTEDGKWSFNEDVTEIFDDMLERSIPQYEVMRSAVTDIARHFMEVIPGGVVDLGCSRGGALAPLADLFPHRNFIGVEASEPMVQAAAVRFVGSENIDVVHGDLRNGLELYVEGAPQAVVLSVLTLQFIPVEYRLGLVAEVHKALAPGGVFILVEKVIGRTPVTGKLFVDLYHDEKRHNGYSVDAIKRKALSLEGVLVPFTAAANEDLLTQAGFAHVECFWRWMNFAGWLAVRP